MRFFPGRFLVYVSLWLLAGCAVQGTRPEVGPLPAAGEILSRLSAQKRPTSYRGLSTISVRFDSGTRTGWRFAQQMPAGSFAGSAVLLWKTPDLFRLEPLSPLGSPLLVMSMKGRSFRVFSPARGRVYVGRADTEGMMRLLGVPVEGGLWLRILRGALPVADKDAALAGGLRVGRDGASGAIRFEIPPGPHFERRQIALLDPVSWLPREVRIGEPGAQVVVRYERFARVGGMVVPESVLVRGPRSKNRLKIAFPLKGDGWRRELSDDLFDIPVPPGARTYHLER